ncbi:hypothetical protein HDU96_001277 [Phlyctochytrium bullatum]|nr:hypothetical protein HDU96_001277 [Phlyctochytrium bullatum]
MASPSSPIASSASAVQTLAATATLAAILLLSLPPTRSQLAQSRDAFLSSLDLITLPAHDRRTLPTHRRILRSLLVWMGWAYPPLDLMEDPLATGPPQPEDAIGEAGYVPNKNAPARIPAENEGALENPSESPGGELIPLVPLRWTAALVVCAALQAAFAGLMVYVHAVPDEQGLVPVLIAVMVLLVLPKRKVSLNNAGDEGFDVVAFTLATFHAAAAVLARVLTEPIPSAAATTLLGFLPTAGAYLASPLGARLHLTLASFLVSFGGFSALRATREDLEDARHRLGSPTTPVPSREVGASLPSRIFFSWLSPLVRVGRTRPLTATDLPDLPATDRAAAVVAAFRRLSATTRFRHLGLRLLVFEGRCFAAQVAVDLFGNACAVAASAVLYRITACIQEGGCGLWEPLAWAAVLGVLAAAKPICEAQVWHMSTRMGVRVAAVLKDAVFEKGLRRVPVAPRARKDTPEVEDATGPDADADAEDEDDAGTASVGKIVTLMSSDAEKLERACAFLFHTLSSPPQILASIAGLLYLLGWPALAGLLVMALTIPATAVIGEWSQQRLETLMRATDRRTDIINETLQGIRIIKLFAWEPNFLRKIRDARRTELDALVGFFVQNAFSFFVWECAPLMVSLGTFVTYTLVAGYEFDAKTAFAAISLFNSLRIPLLAFPQILGDMFQLRVSVRRIQRFLEMPELERYQDGNGAGPGAGREGKVIGFKEAWFSWYTAEDPVMEEEPTAVKSKKTESDETTPLLSGTSSSTSALVSTESSNGAFTLRNVDLDLPVGGLTCVCGATGSGKSSLIQALLGEMKRLSGSAHLPDSRVDSLVAGPEPSIDSAASSFLPRRGADNDDDDDDGELFDASDADRGEWRLHGGVAYVAQTSWLMNATIRDNICFGERYDPVRYARVVRACALVKDFAALEAGDLSEVGEKGINLSGGQKQRISLARACYSRAAFVLLDDPLSAVDAPTARHLFAKAVCGLLGRRTRVLATHAVALTLPRADCLVVLQNGEVLAAGRPAEVVGMAGVQAVMTPDVVAGVLTPAASASRLTVGSREEVEESTKRVPEFAKADRDMGGESTKNMVDFANGKTRENATKLVEVEERQTGAVKLVVYVRYLAAAGGLIFLGVWCASLIASRCFQAVDSFWVNRWVEAYAESNATVTAAHGGVAMMSMMRLSAMTPGAAVSAMVELRRIMNGTVASVEMFEKSHKVNTLFYVLVYGAIAFSWMTCSIVSYCIRCVGSFWASTRLHDLLIDRILGAPIRFFDKTPIGRILNRASKDISVIDQEVMGAFHGVFGLLFDLIAVTLLVTYINPLFFLALLPYMTIYYSVAKDFLACSRELTRLDSTSRSPIYSMFSETLAGASTIRAYGAESRFRHENLRRIDKNHRANYTMWNNNHWFLVRASSIAACMVFTSATITVLTRDQVGAGLAAISMVWSLNFSEFMTYMIREHARLEMTLNAVERVGEYLAIEQEAPAMIEASRPPSDWPSAGAISVKNLELRYAPDLDLVLKDVSVEIPGGSKVGIVGRTGAGKSSFTLGLFRIVEPSGGTVSIDGINLAHIGLRDLRSNLTIIPQDPVLFAGTIRSNIDPFGEFDDARIWSCLERVHILETIQKAPSTDMASLSSGDAIAKNRLDGASALTLDSVVAEGGSNFSQGQRQLLCLARALLKSNKVAVFDEATASVDNETDAKIQETIRGPGFKNVTVLAIAHRLRTVADYDLILVLDKGQVAQYGTPYELIQQEGGIFRGMCEESGELTELEKMARTASLGHKRK